MDGLACKVWCIWWTYLSQSRLTEEGEENQQSSSHKVDPESTSGL